MKIVSYGNTDVGLKRRHNEDSWLIDEKLHLYIVADGMGGHKAGEVASQIATKRIPALLKEYNLDDTDNIHSILEDVINHIHQEVSNEAEIDPDKKGMGTTLCLLLLRDNHFWSTNIGDSPMFLLRDRELIKITKDQTFVQEQLDRGMISLTEAKDHRYRNVLTQSIGNRKTLKIPIVSGPIKNNDIFLLCTDGMSNPLDGDDIISILSNDIPADLKVNRLIERAKNIDGSDNITSVLVHVLSTEKEESLVTDDTIKFENVYTKEEGSAFEDTFIDAEDPLPLDDFDPEKRYLDYDIAEPYGNIDEDSANKKLRVALGGIIIVLLALLIYLFYYFNRMQEKKSGPQVKISQQESHSEPFLLPPEFTDPETLQQPDEQPTIKSGDEFIVMQDDTHDIPSIEQEDLFIDIEIPDIQDEMEKTTEITRHTGAITDTEAINHYQELKSSFINSIYPKKDRDLLNHLCIRFAQHMRQFPHIYTVRIGAYSDPDRSVFGADFFRIIENSDFFILMKDINNIRWYILYLGLYESMERANKERPADKKVYTIQEIFDTEPIILN